MLINSLKCPTVKKKKEEKILKIAFNKTVL